MTQREIPQPASAQAWLAIQKAKGGGHYSGGQIEDFQRGWAVINFGKAHYFHASHGMLVARCGLDWTRPSYIFAEGNWPRCKRCERLA